MKRINYAFSLVMACMMAMTAFYGCSDDDPVTEPEPGNEEEGMSVQITPAQVNTSSATFTIVTSNVEECGYSVVEGTGAEAPDAAVLYQQARDNGRIVSMQDGSNTVTVSGGMVGNTTYTVFFVFRGGDEYQVETQEVTTANYTQTLTILEANMFDMTFHVEVPDSMYWFAALMDRNMYESYRIQFARSDFDCVYYNSYMPNNNPRFRGPRTITFRNGEDANADALNSTYSDGTPVENILSILPGTNYVLMIAECDANGSTPDSLYVPGQGGGGFDDPGILLTQTRSGNLNLGEYTEECEPSLYGDQFTGTYAKQYLFTQFQNQGDGEVVINVTRTTEKTAYVQFVPSENVLQYSALMLDMSVEENGYDLLLQLIGGEDGLPVYVMNNGDSFEGAYETAYPLEEGHEYSMLVTAIYNDEGTTTTFHRLDGIRPIVSDQPAVEMEVHPIETGNPYLVGFNVKAPNGDCAGLKYLMNYTSEWYPMLNSLGVEQREEQLQMMMDQYGAVINDAETLAQINSSEGYNMTWSSMDETESKLVLESYNADEKTQLFNDFDGGTSTLQMTATTGSVPAKEPVESELFDLLQGSWTATFTGMDYMSQDIKTQSAEVNFDSNPFAHRQLSAAERQSLLEYYMGTGMTEDDANAAIDRELENYNNAADHFRQKYVGQNQVVATGLEMDRIYTAFATPWDLFNSTTYSAYSVEDMFRDFGPKLVFEVSKDEEGNDQLTLMATTYDQSTGTYANYIDPLCAWNYYSVGLYGYNSNDATTMGAFTYPVTVSEDGNTLTVGNVTSGDLTYTPSLAYEIMPGYYSWYFRTDALGGLVLTRNAGTQAQTRSAASRNIDNVKAVGAQRTDGTFRRTRMSRQTPVTIGTGRVFNPADALKEVEKK